MVLVAGSDGRGARRSAGKAVPFITDDTRRFTSSSLSIVMVSTVCRSVVLVVDWCLKVSWVATAARLGVGDNDGGGWSRVGI